MGLLNGTDLVGVMNLFVHGLIWTTLGVLLYGIYVHAQTAAQGDGFSLPQHWDQVIEILKTIWIVAAISLALTVMLFTLPKLMQAESAATNCAPSTTEVAYAHPSDASASCSYSVPAPSGGSLRTGGHS